MTQKRVEIALTNPVFRLALAVVLGVAAMFLLLKYEEHMFIENSGGQRKKVLVTRTQLNPGDRISKENVGLQEVPVAFVHANALQSENLNEITDRRVFRKISQNSFLLWSDLDDPNEEASDSARAIVPERGMRATAVPLGTMLSKARLLRKGDLVDIVVHFPLQERGSVTTTLFQNVVVLDQQDSFALVSLSPDQVELMALAQAHGTLTVVMRNRSDLEKKKLKSLTLQEFMKEYETTSSSAAGKSPQSKVEAEIPFGKLINHQGRKVK